MKNSRQISIAAYDRPLDVSFIANEIVVTGPGFVAFSMTREAARASSQRLTALLAAADAADLTGI